MQSVFDFLHLLANHVPFSSGWVRLFGWWATGLHGHPRAVTFQRSPADRSQQTEQSLNATPDWARKRQWDKRHHTSSIWICLVRIFWQFSDSSVSPSGLVWLNYQNQALAELKLPMSQELHSLVTHCAAAMCFQTVKSHCHKKRMKWLWELVKTWKKKKQIAKLLWSVKAEEQLFGHRTSS